MNRRTILIVIVLIAMGVGAYFYLSGGISLPGMESEEESPAPAPAPAPAPTSAPTPTPAPTTPPVAQATSSQQMPEEPPEPVGSHPFAGNKFIVLGNDANSVIVPVESGNGFEIDKSGSRTKKMMVVFEPVEDKENTYFLKSSGLNKYIKFSNQGFGYRTSKPATYHYIIKFTKIGDKYAMSYDDSKGKQYFFGYDGNKLKSDTSVTELISTGLVDVVDLNVTGFVLPGNFGSESDNYREYGPGEDEPITDVRGCLNRLNDIDMDEEYRKSILSVAFNKEAEAPCRAYPQTDKYTYQAGATGWVTTCVDKSKDIEQGCLL